MSQQDYQQFTNKTSADPTQDGFDFQFFAFIYLILHMRLGDTVQYETEDDIVHICHEENTTTLIQAKKSVLNQDGKLPNLTTRDIDIWHTINNWITGSEALGDSTYFKERKFAIWTNKAITGNTFIENIEAFQNGDNSFEEMEQYLDDLISGTSDGNNPAKPNEVKKAMQKLKALNKDDKTRFYNKFTIKIFPDYSIIDTIKQVLEQEKYIPTNKVNEAYNSLYSELKQDKFYEQYNRDKTKLSLSDFNKKYRKCLNKGFDRILNINRSLTGMMPEDILSEKSIQQLIDIKALFPAEVDKIKEVIRKRMCTMMNIDEFRTSGDLLHQDITNLEVIAQGKWDAEFQNKHSDIKVQIHEGGSITDNEFCKAARECHNEVRKIELDFNGYHFDLDIANGYFYEMSEKLQIGWHYNWKDKYK